MHRFFGFCVPFVSAVVPAIVLACLSSRAAAQCDALPQIHVEGGTSECVTAGALRERVVAYAARSSACGGVGLAVSVQLAAAGSSAEVALSRAGHRLSSRRFEQLPSACSELRDMLALSIALAIEHLIPEAVTQARAREPRPARPLPAPDSRAAVSVEVPAAALSASEPAQSASVSEPPLSASETATETENPPTPGPTPAPLRQPVELPAAPAQPAARAPVRDQASALPQPTAAGEPLALQLYAGGQGVLFALPSPIWLGALGFELRYGATSVQLGGLAGMVDEMPLGRGSARISLAGGELYACEGAVVADFYAQLCLGAMGAGLRAHGSGFAMNQGGNSAWAAAALAAAVRWPREAKLALRLSLRGLYSFVRPQFVVERADERALLAALGASARLELIFSIP